MIRVQRLESPLTALGAALTLVAPRPPFASFPADALTRTLQGQIERGHYLLGSRDKRLSAYLGWAMLSDEVATRVLRSGAPPEARECASGEIFWLLTVAATDTAVLRTALAVARRQNAGRRVLAVRRRADGSGHVFDRRLNAASAP